MTNTQILLVCEKYDKHLKSIGIKNDNGCLYSMTDQPASMENSLLHARWMCLQIPWFLEEEKIEKAMRWLGFIQGVLYAQGIFSIDEMRIDNT